MYLLTEIPSTPDDNNFGTPDDDSISEPRKQRFITRFSLADTKKELHKAAEDARKKQAATLAAQNSGRNSPNSQNGNKRRDSYAIKSTAGGDLIKSDDERLKQLELSLQRKKDKADQLFKRKKAQKPPKSPPKTPNYDFNTSRPLTAADEDGEDTFAAFNVAPIVTLDENGVPVNIWSSFIGASTRASIETTQDELTKVYDNYFGEQSRLDFTMKFKNAERDLDRYHLDEDIPAHLLTPRSVFMRETAKARLLPLPLILRKEANPLGIFLGHKGLGDAKMVPVIKVLEKLPAIQSIDFCDNRLTDLTLMPLALKLQSMPNLTYLDLSFNKMDDSSQTIMAYLKDEHCRLRTLLLNGSDIDDSECANLAQAIQENKSIRTLGLSNNLIGEAELLNVLHPDLITGGEAIGDMLRVNTTLTKLDLSWNTVRLDSAIAIALALEVNTTLKVLLLAYNSFGDMPSQVLGRTLKDNKGLTELDIESNSITPKACTVLANAISFNETLLKLNINGNILGKIGAQALVAAIQRSSSESRKLQVSFVNCDCVQDDANIFSA
eukprot:gene29711-36803_t